MSAASILLFGAGVAIYPIAAMIVKGLAKEFSVRAPRASRGFIFRKIETHEKIVGGGACDDFTWSTIETPDGKIEYVRDPEREEQRNKEILAENEHRAFLREAITTRVLTESEMADVLELGTELFRNRFVGVRSGTTTDDQYLKQFAAVLEVQARLKVLSISGFSVKRAVRKNPPASSSA